MLPEDIGIAEIDVTSYPPELQRTYREIFLPVFGFLGGAARAINSSIIELDPRLEQVERSAHPGLFSNPQIAQVSRNGWKKRVDEIRLRPPCCGACPVLSMKDARALWRFLVYDSILRKTGPNADAWIRYRKELLARFQKWKQPGNS